MPGAALVLLLLAAAAVVLLARARGAGAAVAVQLPPSAPAVPMSPRTWWPPAQYADAIAAAEARYALPAGLLARVLYQESHYRPDIISGATLSPAGAIGIAQFMPGTAADYGVDPYNAESSIDGAARYLSDLFAMFGDWVTALAAYNWGLGNVRRKGIGRMPPESRDYATQILTDVGVFG